jgi:membrane-associated phospholipid phosphatase
MALLTVHPLKICRKIAGEVSSHTDRRVEHIAEAVTWGADEHVLAGIAVLGWLVSRRSNNDAWRRFANHALVCSVTTAVLPHLMKDVIDQERPDRLTIEGHIRGIPRSGNANDAFPSGHAFHIGALASAATLLPAKMRYAVWAAGGALVSTRVILLAHWASDVVIGLALGAVFERGLRVLTKPQRIDPVSKM